ncbi:MAG: endonuclease/exonuclease/phosphatase family protein [Acidobacteriota bacterium]
MNDAQHWTGRLRQFKRFDELRRSNFYQTVHSQLRTLLDTPQRFAQSNCRPRIQTFTRVVFWNIERGLRLAQLLRALQEHPVLQHADLLLINEADAGMRRTDDLHITKELARELDMHAVFGAEYLELTNQPLARAPVESEVTLPLHGNAILSRYPLGKTRVVSLPSCFEFFDYEREKRYGRRMALLVDVHTPQGPLTVVTAHLEVVGTPACRARQMKAIMESLSTVSNPVILAGDFNTNTYKRGTLWRSLSALAHLATVRRDSLRCRLTHVEPFEPLFEVLAEYGFAWRDLNDYKPTIQYSLVDLEDASFLGGSFKALCLYCLAVEKRVLKMRLDWMTGRKVLPLQSGERRDPSSGQASTTATTLTDVKASDHFPIVADVVLNPDALSQPLKRPTGEEFRSFRV